MSNQKKKAAKFKGFVPYTLGNEVKVTVKKEQKSRPAELSLLLDFVETGCKVSIEYEESHNCYHVYAMRRDPAYVDAGLILSARHSSLAQACCILRIVNDDVFQGEWASPDKVSDQYTW